MCSNNAGDACSTSFQVADSGSKESATALARSFGKEQALEVDCIKFCLPFVFTKHEPEQPLMQWNTVHLWVFITQNMKHHNLDQILLHMCIFQVYSSVLQHDTTHRHSIRCQSRHSLTSKTLVLSVMLSFRSGEKSQALASFLRVMCIPAPLDIGLSLLQGLSKEDNIRKRFV